MKFHKAHLLFLLLLVMLVAAGTAGAQEQNPPSRTNVGVVVVLSDPHNADVKLDGRFVGKTPLTIKSVPEGIHEIFVSMKGHSSYRTLVRVEAEKTHTISASLSWQIYEQWRGQYASSILSSMLIPGKGQVDNGHNRGWYYLAGYVIASYYGYFCANGHIAANRNFDEQLELYQNETDPDLVVSRYRDMQGSLDDIDSYRKKFSFAMASMGVIWAVNMVDILFFSVPPPIMNGDGNLKVTMNANPGKIQAGLSFRF